jgi:hypothetical protein
MPWIKRLETDEHGENGVIDAIPKKKAEDLIEVIRNGITQIRSPAYVSTGVNNVNQVPQQHGHISHADEIKKLADLKDKGVISEEEFKKMKEKIIGKE